MWTKRQLITEAYAELALAGYVFDLSPEEEQRALRRLDSMLAMWDAQGIRIGYALPASPDESDIDAASGLPDSANETVFLMLAIRLAPGTGKQISIDTRRAAAEGYALLLRDAAQPQPQQLPDTLPRGAGNGRWTVYGGGTYFPTPDDSPLGNTQGGDLNILPE